MSPPQQCTTCQCCLLIFLPFSSICLAASFPPSLFTPQGAWPFLWALESWLCFLSFFLPWSSRPSVLFCPPTNFSRIFHCLILPWAALHPSLHSPFGLRSLSLAFLFILLLVRSHLLTLEGLLICLDFFFFSEISSNLGRSFSGTFRAGIS